MSLINGSKAKVKCLKFFKIIQEKKIKRFIRNSNWKYKGFTPCFFLCFRKTQLWTFFFNSSKTKS